MSCSLFYRRDSTHQNFKRFFDSFICMGRVFWSLLEIGCMARIYSKDSFGRSFWRATEDMIRRLEESLKRKKKAFDHESCHNGEIGRETRVHKKGSPQSGRLWNDIYPKWNHLFENMSHWSSISRSLSFNSHGVQVPL